MQAGAALDGQPVGDLRLAALLRGLLFYAWGVWLIVYPGGFGGAGGPPEENFAFLCSLANRFARHNLSFCTWIAPSRAWSRLLVM